MGILKKENKLLKGSCSIKQKLLETVLEHNSTLIKETSKHIVNSIDKKSALIAHVMARTVWFLINPMEKSLTTQKLPTMSEAMVNYPKLIKKIMALNKFSYSCKGIDDKNFNNCDISCPHTVNVHPNPEASAYD